VVRNQIPNDEESKTRYDHYVQILNIFADGFEQIALALESNLDNSAKPGRAKRILQSVARQVEDWWSEHAAEVVDWGVRIPFLAGGTALLNAAGANMTVGTIALSTLVGGQKVAQAVSSARAAKKDRDAPPKK
jgi:hypothetical protein